MKINTVWKIIGFNVLGVVLFGASAFAMPGMGKSAAERFAAMDKDSNGEVTREEFAEAMPQMREEAFIAIDKDNSGTLSLEEWTEFSAGHARDQQMSGGMQGEGMPGMGMQGQNPENAADKPNLVMPSRKAQ